MKSEEYEHLLTFLNKNLQKYQPPLAQAYPHPLPKGREQGGENRKETHPDPPCEGGKHDYILHSHFQIGITSIVMPSSVI